MCVSVPLCQLPKGGLLWRTGWGDGQLRGGPLLVPRGGGRRASFLFLLVERGSQGPGARSPGAPGNWIWGLLVLGGGRLCR